MTEGHAKQRGAVRVGLLNVCLRALSSVGRFVLLLVLARVLPVDQVGRFGLVTATIYLCAYGIGLDYHQILVRDLLGRPKAQWAAPIRDEFSLFGRLYLGMLPGLLLLFVAGVLPWAMAPWFIALTVVEQLSQELYRLLVPMGKPLTATISLFCRNSAWALLLVPSMLLFPGARSLTWVWSGWLAGGVLSIAIALQAMRELDFGAARRTTIDWSFIRAGLLSALPFLVGSVSMRAMVALDRMILNRHWGEAAVGVYALFFGVCNAVSLLTDAATNQIMLPHVVGRFKAGDMPGYRAAMRRTAVLIAGWLLVLNGGALLLIAPVLRLTGKDVYMESLSTFWVLLGAITAHVVGMLPHFALYVRGADRAIMGASVLGLVVAVTGNLVWVPTHGTLGAALGILCGMGAVALTKLLLVARVRGLVPT